tara:strand:+ start:93 stop:497 length:405 start_codon:yes stop_codon:yes gene_type:complete
MAYKQPSSGLPFKQLGSSPVKQFAGSDKKDILSEVENKREHHQDKFDDWIKGSKKSTEFLNKRADVLKTLKKVTKTKIPKGAKPNLNYEKDFKKAYDALPKTETKRILGKNMKEVTGNLLKKGFTPTRLAKYKK